MSSDALRFNHLIPRLEHHHKRTASVVVILLLPDARVVAVKARYKDYWSFPGGMIDDDETPLQAAVREVQEEVGVTIRTEQLEFVLVVDRESEHLRTYQFVFECPISSEQASSIRIEESELSDYVFVSKTDILGGDQRVYSQTARHWAAGVRGYEEQQFGAGV